MVNTSQLEPALKPGPLPDNPFSPLSEGELFCAFNQCKSLESLEDWSMFAGNDLGTEKHQAEILMLRTSPQVAGRTLGYALIVDGVPDNTSRDCIAREINDCNEDLETLAGLAHLYIFCLIRIFKNPNGPTPFVSPNMSPQALFGAVADEHYDMMNPVGNTPSWLRDQLLLREGHRCALTARIDHESYDDLGKPGDIGATLHVAHIISQSLVSGVGGMTQSAEDKLRWASSAAAVLDRFTGIEIQALLPGLDLHSPLNAMMSSHDPHALFDSLGVWLTPRMDAEGSPIPNTYRVSPTNPIHLASYGLVKEVCFRRCQTPDGKDIAPPSPKLLKIHAACAKIAHMSGAAAVLDKFYEDGDMLPGLSHNCWDMSFNPAGARELERALFRLQVVGT